MALSLPSPRGFLARVFEQHDCSSLLSWSLEQANSVARFKLEEIFPDPEYFGTVFVLPFAPTWVNSNKKKKKKTYQFDRVTGDFGSRFTPTALA